MKEFNKADLLIHI